MFLLLLLFLFLLMLTLTLTLLLTPMLMRGGGRTRGGHRGPRLQGHLIRSFNSLVVHSLDFRRSALN